MKRQINIICKKYCSKNQLYMDWVGNDTVVTANATIPVISYDEPAQDDIIRDIVFDVFEMYILGATLQRIIRNIKKEYCREYAQNDINTILHDESYAGHKFIEETDGVVAVPLCARKTIVAKFIFALAQITPVNNEELAVNEGAKRLLKHISLLK